MPLTIVPSCNYTHAMTIKQLTTVINMPNSKTVQTVAAPHQAIAIHAWVYSLTHLHLIARVNIKMAEVRKRYKTLCPVLTNKEFFRTLPTFFQNSPIGVLI